MTSEPNPIIAIQVTLRSTNPQLLAGLENWLRLGLISDAQILKIAQTSLSCPLPEPVPIPVTTTILEEIPVPLPPRRLAPVAAPQAVPPLARVLQSFREEFSVRWLLFVGVFLVVISSGVLAATQWSRFPAVAQYGVLWSYTLIFAGVGWSLAKRDDLRLTGQTLKNIALFLIPVNFWAIDSFGLWFGFPNILAAAIATITLSGITWFLLVDKVSIPYPLALLALSYLESGWKMGGVAPGAIYLGTLITTLLLGRKQRQFSPFATLYIFFALWILLARGLFVENLDIEQFALTIGLTGWLLTRLNLPPPFARILPRAGTIFLASAWLISISEQVPWQATVISLLIGEFFWQRLRRSWRRLDLFVLFIVTVQGLPLFVRLVPLQVWVNIVYWLTFWTEYLYVDGVLAILGVYLYLFLWLWGMGRLYRRSKVKLAYFGECLALGLGLLTCGLGLLVPSLRSLSLTLFTLSSLIVAQRTTIRVIPIYLTHVFALASVVSIIFWWYPDWGLQEGSLIFLGLTAIEWLFVLGWQRESLSDRRQLWQDSCWKLGFILAGLSYLLFWHQTFSNSFFNPQVQNISLLGLIIPITLTGVAFRSTPNRRQQGVSFSIIALIALQFLTLWQPQIRLINLGVATMLMGLNIYLDQRLIIAKIHFGFAFALLIGIGWEHLEQQQWFLGGAIVILMLSLLRRIVRPSHSELWHLYREAATAWGNFLTWVVLGLLTLLIPFFYQFLIFTPEWSDLGTTLIIGVAMLDRHWYLFTNQAVFGLGLAIELALALVIILNQGTALDLATGNIILGLITLILTHYLTQKRSQENLSSLKILPLLYAVLGLLLSFNEFNAYTGFLTLGAALTGIGVGTRYEGRKFLTYLSLGGITIAWYELVIYQLLQTSGGSTADGLTILAGVAVIIAFIYRLFPSWWEHQNRGNFENLQHFSLGQRLGLRILSSIKLKNPVTAIEWQMTAHIHWLMGTIIILMSIPQAIVDFPRLTGWAIILNLALASYALSQGKNQPEPDNLWVYVGILQGVSTWIYARLIWSELAVVDNWLSLIVCLIAYSFSRLPWGRWGWRDEPWRNGAIALPLFTALLQIASISTYNLLLIAGFYVLFARFQKNQRWTYFSLFFINWAFFRFFFENNLTEPLWYATTGGLSILYIAEFDPALQKTEYRETRHTLRLTGTSIISVVALVTRQEPAGLIPMGIGLGIALGGLGLKVRAFLYVGTITFMVATFYQLIILVVQYAFLKWVVGLMAGISLIIVAANFERSRDRVSGVWQNWLDWFDRWS